jgi:hypothetical protein
LASLKTRGETYSAIASLVDLPVAEATKLIRSTRNTRSSTDRHVRDDSQATADNDGAAFQPDSAEDELPREPSEEGITNVASDSSRDVA